MKKAPLPGWAKTLAVFGCLDAGDNFLDAFCLRRTAVDPVVDSLALTRESRWFIIFIKG